MWLRIGAVCALGAYALPACASDAPLYQPAPAWIAKAPAIDTATLDDRSPFILRYDNQQRLERGRVWNYIDTARRATTAQQLSEIGTVTVPWLPDKGDLIVHGAEIIRGTERIDLLKSGPRFVVLRREQNLEQRELTGALTATLAVQGLQIGDVLHVTLSITQADPALKGQVQSFVQLPADPFRAAFARTILSWPMADPVHWKVLADGVSPAQDVTAGFRTLTIALPLAKLPDLPNDMPARFARLPLLNTSSFADWAAVSRTMAPLFATDGLIPPGSPLAAEVARIVAADPTPLGRAERALELVQDKIRYLALGMNGGNYVPQTPVQTWDLRYGDCKAKTLLLLSMLRSMGIEAEATLARSRGGDAVSVWLPMPGAFDHVLVRATIDGKTLWLDGTSAGARLADINDTPPFRYVLPLRAAGATLLPIETHADARPTVDVALALDQRAGVDLPTLFHATMTLRGPQAAAINAAINQAGPKQKSEAIETMLQSYVQDGQFADSSLRYDPVSGTAIATASGLLTTPWRSENKRLRQTLDRTVSAVSFEPDRARPTWREIPVATAGPQSIAFHGTTILPDGGKDYTLEGDQTLSGTLGGTQLHRTTRMADGTITVDDRADMTGIEIAPAAVAAERARVAVAQTRLLRVVAPANPQRRWDNLGTGHTDPRYAGIESAFAKAIAAHPETSSGLYGRASFRAGIFDRAGAIDDLGKGIAIEPSVDLYLMRAGLRYDLGQNAAALADAEAARALDPANSDAITRVATLQSDQGKSAAALALVQERVDLGGKDRFDYLATKAEIQADGGDVTGALATLDSAIAEKAGDPNLLNMRCWLKGTRSVGLDTALKDCTKAIELDDDPNAALDSRALVYFRLNRLDDALADLDAVIDAAPGQAGSRFLRGIVRKRSGKAAEGDADLRIARLLSPQIDRVYKRYGIVA